MHLGSGFKQLLRRLFFALVDSLYPHRCPSCRKVVESESFCKSCWKKLYFIEGTCCLICGEPLGVGKDWKLVCADCLKRNYYFDRTISVFIYNRTIARAIY
ncbi:MAG: double zinc ribbon domain-containing protein, partial [Rickettsiales bacterium]|nr:double zinc ribbon domain-containing protein [Rickettsiales bacterium]